MRYLKVIIVSVLCVLSLLAKGQNTSDTYSKAYALLREQSTHPTDPLVYFKLGHVFYSMSETEHPIRDYGDIQWELYNMRLYYGNCVHFLGEELPRSEEFQSVPHSGKKATMADVVHFLDEQIELASTCSERVTALYESYYRLFHHYEQCRLLFSAFSQAYPREKNAHLLIDEAHYILLDSLSRMADSVRLDIDAYQQALAACPVARYSSTFTWQDIRLYRIDGLTRTDLLGENVMLWNYGEWVHHFLEEQATTYKAFYADLQQALLSGEADKLLLNTISRLDYESWMYSWLVVRSSAKQMQQHVGDAEWSTMCEEYLDNTIPLLYEQYVRLSDVRHSMSDLRRRISNEEIRKYVSVLDTMGVDSILHDAELHVGLADEAYRAMAGSLMQTSGLRPEPFKRYENEFSAETFTAASLAELGLGNVVAVVQVGYRYLAILDDHTSRIFDAQGVYGEPISFEGSSAVVGAYKLSSNTIAILMEQEIMFVDNSGKRL